MVPPKCSSFCFRAYWFLQLTDAVDKNAGGACVREEQVQLEIFAFSQVSLRWSGFSHHSVPDTNPFHWVECGRFHLLKWCQMISNGTKMVPKEQQQSGTASQSGDDSCSVENINTVNCAPASLLVWGQIKHCHLTASSTHNLAVGLGSSSKSFP